jgi:serine/threonine protein kinase
MKMNPDNWERAKELFEAALELDSSKRASFLAENCREENLRQQVEKLLINYQEAGSFLDDPVLNPGILAPNNPGEIQTEEASRLHPQSGELLAATTSAEEEDPMVGRQLGAYKLVRRVGQGGMAAVFLASRADDEYRKQVAVKLVQPGLDSRDLLNRFRNERQTLAGLDHPNIVKLLDGGSTPEGLPFLVMDYVEGSPIDEYCDRHKLSVDERLHLFGKVCEAVQYAHQKLVVHRDLKPSNILVVADGTPKLLDFGIAKVLNPEPSQNLVVTQTGTRCMTPAYASPEQMRGKSVTPATDIYSLGVVLYELLTGHRPYRLTQHTPAEIERAICDQEPETPSTVISRVETDTSSDGSTITRTPESVSQTREGQPDKLRRRLRGDLDNIVLKALQKEPRRRYDSVTEFSQDVERHLQHLPVKARPSTLAYSASKFVQRHQIEVSAAVIVLLVLVGAALLAFNTLGFRDRVLGGAGSTRIQSTNGARSVNPKGGLAQAVVGATPAVSCESLADLDLPVTTITLAQSVPAGAFAPPGEGRIPNLPDFCRVEGVINAAIDSNIHFEVWIPSSGWNGKFLGIGNFGLAGSINFSDMAPAVRSGYATASTDTGHHGEQWDASWALGHPEKVIDFGYRAVHEMTDKAKAIVQAFYGQAPKWSFFEGCSNGGREALMEAQRFPNDYQGILSGAPSNFATHLLVAAVYNTQALGLKKTASYIPDSKIPAISAAVLAACDAQDGITDGILNDPRQCHFDPSTLLCERAESDSCLTSAQVAQLKKIYAGLRNSKGEQIFPGYMPGGEEGASGWKGEITEPGAGRGEMFLFGMGYFRYLVFDNPAWDYRTLSAESTARMADAKTAQALNATDPDLRPFKARGGKLILYQGWSDPLIPGLGTINYHDSVVAKLGLPETESFVRLYMAPGMQHCYGGPGPNSFGQFDFSSLDPKVQPVSTATDPQHNVSRALEQWVEKGIAPGPIIATKYANDLDPSQGVKMTRPLCPYPQIAKYKGTGDTNDAANFICSRIDNE